jgi:hypothetical protein
MGWCVQPHASFRMARSCVQSAVLANAELSASEAPRIASIIFWLIPSPAASGSLPDAACASARSRVGGCVMMKKSSAQFVLKRSPRSGRTTS